MDGQVTHNRYVAHFDMLGFKGAIRKNLEEAWGALCDLQAAMDEILRLRIGDIGTGQVIDRTKAYIFSDTILVFTLSDQPDDLKSILILTSHLFAQALAKCVPLRGGIAVGKFYFNDQLNLFCGKPFVDAYAIAERAQWCGIIVDDPVAERYFNDSSRLTSNNAPVIMQWAVPIKPAGQSQHWVVNWPYVHKRNFLVSPPISAKAFYQAFEGLFGPYDGLNPNDRAKYVNTVDFINSALNAPESFRA